MKLNFRYLGMIIDSCELNPKKEYIVGRDSASDIRLTKDFISRTHAKIYFQDEKWWYQDLREEHPHYRPDPIEINNERMIELENDIDILTEDYLNNHKTGIYDFKDLRNLSNAKQTNRRWIQAGAVVATIVAATSGWKYYDQYKNGPLTAEALKKHVEQRYVAFEMIKDHKLEDEFIKLSKLEKKDFKETSGYCSGFLVAPKIVMTASHCLLGGSGIDVMSEYQLKTHDGKYHQVSKILGVDLTKDIMLLEVDSMKGYPHFNIEDKHKIGQKVYTIGNVHGEGMAIRDGSVSSMTKDPNNPKIEYLRFSAAASPGNSGGPLVNDRGQVMGLVFARSNAAENYNLSSPYFELTKFINSYHKDRSEKEISINTQDTIFGSVYGVVSLYTKLEILNDFAFSILGLQEDQEKLDQLNQIKFTVKVPMEAQKFLQEVAVKANQSMKGQVAKLVEQSLGKKESGLSWLDQPNKDHNILIPVHSNRTSEVSIGGIKDNLLWEQQYLIIKPGLFDNYDKSAHQYNANLNHVGLDKNLSKSEKKQFPLYFKYQSYGMFSDFLSYESSAVLLDPSLEQSLAIDEKKYKETHLNKDKGATIIPYNLGYSFIRPKKLKEIKITEYSFNSENDVKDRFGRVWKKDSFTLLKGVHVARYCLDYPQAKLCVNKPYMITTPSYKTAMIENYENIQLAEFMIGPSFWTVASLENYLRGDKPVSYEFTDVAINKNENQYEVDYKFLSQKYVFDEKDNVSQIKFFPAVFRDKDGKSHWINYGHQTFHPKQGKQKAKVCTTEIDFPKYKNSSLAANYNSQKKSEEISLKTQEKELKLAKSTKAKKLIKRSIAGLKKHSVEKLYKVSKFKSPYFDGELVRYSSCRTVEHDAYNDTEYMSYDSTIKGAHKFAK